MKLRKYILQLILFLGFFIFIFFSSFTKIFAEEINWIAVAKTNNEIQFLDSNSIKYNNRGFLTVIIKHSEVNPLDQKVITTNSYLMVVDCENRLYSKLPIMGDPRQVKIWEEPTNDKLTKKTIISSCNF